MFFAWVMGPSVLLLSPFQSHSFPLAPLHSVAQVMMTNLWFPKHFQFFCLKISMFTFSFSRSIFSFVAVPTSSVSYTLVL